MYRTVSNWGPWEARALVNGVQEDYKPPTFQFYPPHGSLPPSKARSGGLFTLEVEHWDPLGERHVSGPNACIIP